MKYEGWGPRKCKARIYLLEKLMSGLVVKCRAIYFVVVFCGNKLVPINMLMNFRSC